MIPVAGVTLGAAQWLVGVWLVAGLPGPRVDGGRARPRVSVIIPARNEETSLPGLLASLAAQSAPAAEVFVVDDGSTDATAARARAAGATVIDAPEPPAGWRGKPAACAAGVDASSGELLVFLDADVTLGPDALAALVDEHDRRNGLVSVQPYHRTERAYEKLSAIGNAVTMMGTGAFTRPRVAPRVAFGPCVVTDRDSYRASGGHRHPDVRDKIMEDAALARRYRAMGAPVTVLAGRGQVAFRMHPDGFRQFVDGWTRSLTVGARLGRPWAAVGAFFWVWGALLAGWHLLGVLTGGPHAVVWTVAYAAWAGAVAWMLRRIGKFGPVVPVLFPLAVAVFALLTVRSLGVALLGRGTPWRGRRVDNR